MKGYLEKNLASLPWVASLPKNRGILFLATSRTGLPVPGLREEGKSYPLHSLFDPLREGEKLRKTYGPGGVKIFLGLGGAYQILPFAGDSRILIIEPDREMAGELLRSMDFSDLFSRENVSLLIAPGESEIVHWILNNYLPLLDGTMDVIPLRSWQERRDTLFRNCLRSINRAVEEISADCSTQKKLGRQWQRNIIASYYEALENPFIPSRLSSYREFIITAAGPGLEEQEERLRGKEDTCFLLTVDTALPVLLKMGIEPDGIITIDPQAVGYLHFMEQVPSRCLILADWGSPVHRLGLENDILTISSSHPLCRYFIGKGGYPLMNVTRGGNVTGTAVSLAGHCGIQKITLLGADFSYPGRKPYCRGSYFSEWHYLRSGRLDTHLNRLLQFVLERSRGYESPLLKGYERDFRQYLSENNASFSRGERGLWEITLEKDRPNPPPLESKCADPAALLEEYARELRSFLAGDLSLSLSSPPPVLQTLIPLGYSFLKENGGEALKKAARYTLDLLSVHIS